MYGDAAVLAALLLIYSAVAGWVGRSWVSGPILFMLAGLIFGPAGLGMLRMAVTAQELRTVAELALAMVLFTDAARADLGTVRRVWTIPGRLLLVGLPLSILLGFLLARLIFPGLGIFEVALLAALLAPTDAALGAPVVTHPAVPADTREALNLESGLNDGICVPVVVILLTLAVGTETGHMTAAQILSVVAEEIGIGAVSGLGLTAAAIWLLRRSARLGLTSPHWLHIPVVALAALCFATAQGLGGSGFIACFVGGLLFGALQGGRAPDLLSGAASTGEVLALLTWAAFGGPVLERLLPRMTWLDGLYAVLSLTVIRMLPVYLSLMGTRLSAGTKLFIGWFGPRGLATIVFAVIVVNAGLPGGRAIATVAGCTILLSVVAHGVTANPLVSLLAPRRGALPRLGAGPSLGRRRRSRGRA